MAGDSELWQVSDRLLLFDPVSSVQIKPVNVVAVRSLGLNLRVHPFTPTHYAVVGDQGLDRNSLLPRHFLHESHQEVFLVEEAGDPEFTRSELVVCSLVEQLLDVTDPLG